MADDFGTQDIIDYRGLGLGYNRGGSLYSGNSMLAAGAHADGTAVKTAVDCHASSMNSALDRISAQNFEGRFNQAITSLRDGQFQLEIRTNDQARATDRTLNDMRLEQCRCCEESKLLNCQTESRLAQRMEAIETGRVRDENAKLQARVNQLEIFRECGCGCGGGVTPCPS